MNKELRELIEAQCDGTATAAQRDRLQQLMDEDHAAVRSYVEYLDLHAQLQWHSRGVRALPSELTGNENEIAPMPGTKFRQAVAFFSRQTPLSLTVATLVIMLLVTSMAFMAAPFYRVITAKDKPEAVVPPTFVAEITGLHNAVWRQEQAEWKQGVQLESGQLLELSDGVAEITFDNGALVLLQGPTRFRLIAEDTGRLLDGKLTAKLPPSANPSETARFLVETAIAPVVDLGTEFGVSIRGNRLLDVHVFDGKVAVEASRYIRQRRVLQAGDALHVDTVMDSISQSKAERSRFTLKADIHTPDRWRKYASTLLNDPDLIAYYTFDADEKNSRRVTNLGNAGAALDGVNQGAKPAEGRWSDKPALYFEGPESGQFVDLGSKSIKRLSLTDGFTVAVWFRAAEVKGRWSTVVAKGDSAWRLHFMADGRELSFGAMGGSARELDLVGGGNAADGRWHLATIVYEAGDEYRKLLYIDGKLAGTQILATPITANDHPVYLGDNAERPGRNFHGWLDEVAILTRAFSPAEVNEFYRAGSPSAIFQANEAN